MNNFSRNQTKETRIRGNSAPFEEAASNQEVMVVGIEEGFPFRPESHILKTRFSFDLTLLEVLLIRW